MEWIEQVLKYGTHPNSYHTFSNIEIEKIRFLLLDWYEQNERPMPWRVPCSQPNPKDAQRAYQVWVSEMMLQQTQVNTVIPYYNRWMSKFKTLKDVAEADEDQLLQLWSGLGYYTRAKRLHQGAQFVVETFQGVLPQEPQDLLKIPGIGPYTAGAIASIAYQLPEPLVDGNVIRVLSRLRAYGGNPKSKESNSFYWKSAKDLVDPLRPDHFNQALMDLGATVCTPINPTCSQCPMTTMCLAYQQKRSLDEKKKTSFFTKTKKHSGSLDMYDIEECTLCPSIKGQSLDVTLYPAKTLKNQPREQGIFFVLKVMVDTHVCLIEAQNKLLLIKGPSQGLLANLYDFPNCDSQVTSMDDYLGSLGIQEKLSLSDHFMGDVEHKFSHIKRRMKIAKVVLQDMPIIKNGIDHKWLSLDEIHEGTHAFPATVQKALSVAYPKKATSQPRKKRPKRE